MKSAAARTIPIAAALVPTVLAPIAPDDPWEELRRRAELPWWLDSGLREGVSRTHFMPRHRHTALCGVYATRDPESASGRFCQTCVAIAYSNRADERAGGAP